MKATQIFYLLLGGIILFSCGQQEKTKELLAERSVWTTDQANQWYAHQPWLRGSDFIPSSAINQLEMWQAEIGRAHV